MDEFIKACESLYASASEPARLKSTLFININQLEKQYIIYYLYRIIIAYIGEFYSASLMSSIEQLFSMLGLSTLEVYVSLKGKLPTNEQKLNAIFTAELTLLRDFSSKNTIAAANSENSKLITFIKKKKLATIIDDIKTIVVHIPSLA